MKKRITKIIFFLIVFSAFVMSAHSLETIELRGGERASRTMNLVAGDRVTGTVSCIDNGYGYTHPVDFWINSPNGTIAVYQGTVGTSFSFTATKDGIYTLWFYDNDWDFAGNEAKFRLDYSVDNSGTSAFSGNTPYIIVTAIALVLAVIFGLIAFRRRKQTTDLKPPSSPQQPMPQQ